MYDMGYEIDPTCQRCKVAHNTIFHRLYECNDPEVVRIREDPTHPTINKYTLERARAAGPQDPLYTRGWVKPGVWEPPASNGEAKFLIDGKPADITEGMSGKLFTDGAAYPSRVKSLSRAGWAVVQLDDTHKAARVLYGTVWAPLAQTSQCAEWVG